MIMNTRRTTRAALIPAIPAALMILLAALPPTVSRANVLTPHAPPAWQRPPIYTVEATNKPIAPSLPVAHALQVLSKLLETNATADTAVFNRSERSLAELTPGSDQPETNRVARLNRLHIINSIKRNNALFRMGDQQQACDNLMALLETTDDPELERRIISMLGILNFKRREFEAASRYFARALEYAPGNTQLACNLAGAYMSYGALDQAEEVLLNINTELIRADALKSAVHFNLACINSLRGRIDPALDHLALAATADPVFTATNMGDPQLDAIRNTKRFERIQRQIRLDLNQEEPKEVEAEREPDIPEGIRLKNGVSDGT